jgi:hypothetical protein
VAAPEETSKTSAAAEDEPLSLLAFPTIKRNQPTVEPSPRFRDWINSMEERWANRCLPLLMANEAGWVMRNPHAFEATWGGEPSTKSITITFDRDDIVPPHLVASHFGYGILTWAVPFLFRTSPGYNLLVRGPANLPKDGICALEGLVETDWAIQTFTMNWKITRPDHTIRFEEGEPFCMIVPQRRGELEAFRPMFRDFSSDPETHAAAEAWVKLRDQTRINKFLSEYSAEYSEYVNAWEQHYFRGTAPDGTSAPDHQTRIKLSEFTPE